MKIRALNYDLYWKRNCFIGNFMEDFEIIDVCPLTYIKLKNTDYFLGFEGNELIFCKNKHGFIKSFDNHRCVTFESSIHTGKFIRHRCKKLYLEEKSPSDKFFEKDHKWIILEGYQVAWLCPYPILGSGGIRTLLNMAYYNSLEKDQHVDLWVKIQPWEDPTNEHTVKSIIQSHYGVNLDVYIYRKHTEIPYIYNTIYCTNPYTTYDCNEMEISTRFPFFISGFNMKHNQPSGKILFMQDTEWFRDFI